MSIVERYIEGLQQLKSQVATSSLESVPESEKNGFGFGKAVGRLEGVKLADELLNKLLDEQDQDQKRREDVSTDGSKQGRRTRA